LDILSNSGTSTARAAPPKFAAQTSGPSFGLAYPRAYRRAPLTKGALHQKRCRSLLQKLEACSKPGWVSGRRQSGPKLFSSPLPARPERRLNFKAPCAVLAGWARRAAQGGRAVSAGRMPARTESEPPRQGGAHTVSRHNQTANALAPLNNPPLASRRSCRSPINTRRAFAPGRAPDRVMRRG